MRGGRAERGFAPIVIKRGVHTSDLKALHLSKESCGTHVLGSAECLIGGGGNRH